MTARSRGRRLGRSRRRPFVAGRAVRADLDHTERLFAVDAADPDVDEVLVVEELDVVGVVGGADDLVSDGVGARDDPPMSAAFLRWWRGAWRGLEHFAGTDRDGVVADDRR